jgi:DnaK suppressor protein
MAAKKTARKAQKKTSASRRKVASKKAASRKKSASKKKRPVSKKGKVSKKRPVSKKKPAARKKAPKKAAKKAAKKTASRKGASKKKVAKKKPAAKKKASKKKVPKKTTAKKKASSKKPASRKKASTKRRAVKKTVSKKKPTRTSASSKRKGLRKAPAPKKRVTRKVKPKGDPLSGPIHGIKPYIAKLSEEYMSKKQLKHFRKILSSWKSELMTEVDRTVHHMQDEAANFPDPNDRATQESEFGLELRTRDRERKLLRKINGALTRIDDGSYGYCDETGEEIGLKRLEARPVAQLSLEAQERREVAERQFRDTDDRYR